MNQRSSRKVPEAFVSDAVKTIGLVQFWCVYQPSDVMRLYFFRGIFVYSLEQGLHSSPRPPFMVFVTQVMTRGFPNTRQLPFTTAFMSPWNFWGLLEEVRMMGGGLPIPNGAACSCCWGEGGSDPAPNGPPKIYHFRLVQLTRCNKFLTVCILL
jgi:hypothetical protein